MIVLVWIANVAGEPVILFTIIDRLVEADLGPVTQRATKRLRKSPPRFLAGAIRVRRDTRAALCSPGASEQSANVEILPTGDRKALRKVKSTCTLSQAKHQSGQHHQSDDRCGV